MLKIRSSSTLATWWKELTHLKKPWCWEGLKVEGEGDNRGWDGWMASPTWWTWVWISAGSWWWTGRPGVLQSMGLQRVGHHSAYRAHTHTKVIKHKDGNKHGACVLKRHCQEQWLLSFLVSGFFYILKNCLNFPGSPAAKTPYSQCRGLGLDPWLGN